MKNMFAQKLRDNQTLVLLAGLLLFAFFLHGYNAFHYPYFESDEGTYMSQAYAVKEYGEIAPYTYWYDHPPLGWFSIGVWVDLLGQDWNFFGSSLNTGRALMLILHVIQVALLFYITRRITGSDWIAVFVCLLFTVSPLATYFQRRVLLDNIMTTWVLAAVAFLFRKTVRLRDVLFSGFFYGLAVTTKITAVMFGPAFLYLLLTASWPVKKSFRVAGWLGISGAVTALWPIYALIKTEFFPSDGSTVSLVDTLLFQASRGPDVPFWDPESSFMDNLDAWMILDATYVYVVGFGLVSAVGLALFSGRYRFFALATLLYFVFIIRGGVVLGFYVLPMLPFVAISLGAVMWYVDRWIRSVRPRSGHRIALILFMLILVVGTFHYVPKVEKYLTVDETSNQMAGLIWVKENLPEDTIIMIDVFGMTELLDPTFVNDKQFRNADWYFKVAKDPEIRFDRYRDDWRNADYILISHEMLYQAEREELPVVKDAIRNSRPVVIWDDNSTAYVDVQNFISTNGDWLALYQVNDRFETQLLYSWNYYRDNFIHSYGQVIDPQRDVTTSEGQSYAMIKAALMNDRDAFTGLWLWTQHKLQHRIDDKLLSWLWGNDEQLDSNNATDADMDIALALIFASQMFDEPEYLDDAREIIADIWRQAVIEIDGRHYLLPMAEESARRGDVYLLNPSYFSPAHYRLFDEIDETPGHDWRKLAEDTYATLDRISAHSRNPSGLPPNWLTVHGTTGTLTLDATYIRQENGNVFGFDAFRIYWRVALDVEWYGSDAGRSYLEEQGAFFEREWERRGAFPALYDLQGRPLVSYNSQAVDAGILLALEYAASGQQISEVYNTLFSDELTLSDEEEYAYWGDPDAYYDFNWSWLGLALFNDRFPNIWEERRSQR